MYNVLLFGTPRVQMSTHRLAILVQTEDGLPPCVQHMPEQNLTLCHDRLLPHYFRTTSSLIIIRIIGHYKYVVQAADGIVK